ncbi:MAG: AmmeMemoRadiSam system protein A, partial [Magnetococcales bacterium]|nr:AmmeMemoRadiSam system protein A [Magnetococcales bacterium]
ATTLLPLLDDHTLLVISGDFTHYGQYFDFQPFPVDSHTEQRLKELDLGAVEKISARDPQGLMDYRLKTGITACAYGPVMVLLNLLDQRVEPRLVQYRTSGSNGGDFSHSVSYVAMIFYASQPLAAVTTTSDPLPDASMKRLHALAVNAVRGAVDPHYQAYEIDDKETQQRFNQPAGAFVTLKRDGELRGCIGQLSPDKPLYRAVTDHAVNAALRDPRFSPVTPGELQQMTLEVSILSPMRPISSWEGFIVGRQGIVLSKNGRRAVFLPEVATEQGWSREETLTHLAQKAGLPPDSWKSGATFEVFTSQSYTAPILPSGS